MAIKIPSPSEHVLLQVSSLSSHSFSPFGTLVENPAPSLTPSPKLEALPPNAVQANQGSALKYVDVTNMKDYSEKAPSGKQAKAVMNMFVCAPRELLPSENGGHGGLFPVKILERHPYTTQTFIPMGLSKSDAKKTRYLVIVAPSLEPSPADVSLPVPPSHISGDRLPGRGLPDLSRVTAFIANGSQAITYGAGTW